MTPNKGMQKGWSCSLPALPSAWLAGQLWSLMSPDKASFHLKGREKWWTDARTRTHARSSAVRVSLSTAPLANPRHPAEQICWSQPNVPPEVGTGQSEAHFLLPVFHCESHAAVVGGVINECGRSSWRARFVSGQKAANLLLQTRGYCKLLNWHMTVTE